MNPWHLLGWTLAGFVAVAIPMVAIGAVFNWWLDRKERQK